MLDTVLSHEQKHFLLRRLHSLMGVIPLGFFLAFHLFENSKALQGPKAYDEMVATISGIPYLVVLEWVALLGPILYHGIYGVFIASDAHHTLRLAKYGAPGTWRFYLQRATGVLLIAFLVYHVFSTRIQIYYLGWVTDHLGNPLHSPTYEWMARYLHETWWTLPFYALGVTAAAYHFANGLWSFAITWGLTVRAAAQKGFLLLVSAPLFLALAGMGIYALLSFDPPRNPPPPPGLQIVAEPAPE